MRVFSLTLDFSRVSLLLLDSFLSFPVSRFRPFSPRFKKKEVTFVDTVLDELEFDSYNLYSVSGCKRISAKVELLLPDVEEELVDSPWRL